jgi:hypothetical protein
MTHVLLESLMAGAIGLIPESGRQMIFVTLYARRAVPCGAPPAHSRQAFLTAASMKGLNEWQSHLK